jgi:hypothetical protein
MDEKIPDEMEEMREKMRVQDEEIKKVCPCFPEVSTHM